MITKANYFKLGLFVIVASGILVVGVIVLSAGLLARDEVLVETYMDESVQGLDAGSPVMRRGVPVGRVEEITFVSRVYGATSEAARDSNLVMVVMSIDRSNLPSGTLSYLRSELREKVRGGLRTQLASQGITGLKYVEIEEVDPKQYPLPDIGWEPQHPYVPSVPSTLISFTKSVDRILAAVERVDFVGIAEELRDAVHTLSTAVDELKVGEMRGEVIALLKDMRKTSGLVAALVDQGEVADPDRQKPDLAGVVKSLDELVGSLGREIDELKVKELRKDVDSLVAELRETNQSLKALVDTSRKDFAREVSEVAAEVKKALRRVERVAAGQQADIEAILANLRQVSENLMRLSETAEKYPSQVFFGEAPPQKEK